jgi:hypothetical protein
MAAIVVVVVVVVVGSIAAVVVVVVIVVVGTVASTVVVVVCDTATHKMSTSAEMQKIKMLQKSKLISAEQIRLQEAIPILTF